MPEFLTTIQINALLERIITTARKEIFLVSPYLQLSDNFQQRLQDANARGVQITFVYGKGDLQQKEMQHLCKLSELRLFYYHDLHAKCYFNENSMLITSMNMYEYSQKNREMGIGIERMADPALYQEARTETFSIITHAELKKGTVTGQFRQATGDQLNYLNWKKALHDALVQAWATKVVINEEEGGALKIKTTHHQLTCYIELSGGRYHIQVEKILTQKAYQAMSANRYYPPSGYQISFEPGNREYYDLVVISSAHALRARTLSFITPEEVMPVYDQILQCALILDELSKQAVPQIAWR